MKIGLLTCGLVAALLSGCTSANLNVHRDEDLGEEIRLDVVADGYVLPVFEHRRRSYVEGRPGQRYRLRITNRSPRRIEVVAAVDGRDVIDGRPMDADKRGYIINPHDAAVIDGFRTSMETVAAFRFTSPEDSYSSRMGTPEEIGQIAVAVFREKTVPRGPIQLQDHRVRPAGKRLGEAQAAPQGAPAESGALTGDRSGRHRRQKSNLGTRFGETLSSGVQEVDFVRESSSPDFWLGLRYDDASGLCEKGLEDFCGGGQKPLLPVHHQEPEGRFAQPPP